MDDTLTFQIRDPETIAKFKKLASDMKKKDWRKYARETVRRLTKQALGEEADMSTKEAAAELGVHLNTIFNYKRQGLFPNSYYITSRKLRIAHRDVMALKARTVAAA